MQNNKNNQINENKIIDIQIIVPVYNVEPYLDEFFQCVMNQSIQNFIIIAVDDASSDGSYDKLQHYKNILNDRLIIIKNLTNLGPSATRNTGLDVAEKHPSKYISFLDSDDRMDPDYLKDLYENAEKYNAGLTISGIQRFEDRTNHVICTEMISYTDQFITDLSTCDDFAYINPCPYSKLYRYENIKHIRFRPMNRSEDTCYFFEALPLLKSVKFTNHALYHYRIRQASLSGAINEKKYHAMHVNFAEMLSLFEREPYKDFKEIFETQIFIRSSIGGVCRYAFNDMRRSGELCRRELEYLDSSVPGWRKNKYLTFHKKMNKGMKPLALRICALMYKMHNFPIFVHIYYFMSQILKKDVRA